MCLIWGANNILPFYNIPGKEFTSDHGAYTGMETDFETDSRSADSMEEVLPDIPSPPPVASGTDPPWSASPPR